MGVARAHRTHHCSPSGLAKATLTEDNIALGISEFLCALNRVEGEIGSDSHISQTTGAPLFAAAALVSVAVL